MIVKFPRWLPTMREVRRVLWMCTLVLGVAIVSGTRDHWMLVLDGFLVGFLLRDLMVKE
jgi:hypothetical protein